MSKISTVRAAYRENICITLSSWSLLYLSGKGGGPRITSPAGTLCPSIATTAQHLSHITDNHIGPALLSLDGQSHKIHQLHTPTDTHAEIIIITINLEEVQTFERQKFVIENGKTAIVFFFPQ